MTNQMSFFFVLFKGDYLFSCRIWVPFVLGIVIGADVVAADTFPIDDVAVVVVAIVLQLAAIIIREISAAIFSHIDRCCSTFRMSKR